MGICTQGESKRAYQEHIEIFEAIRKQDAELSASLVQNHLSKILENSKSLA